MEDCIFCMLADGTIKTSTLYEDDDFRVILDAAPATKGHCLILPKKHYQSLFDMPEDLTGKAFALARRIAPVLKKVTGCQGLNVLQNSGSAAGQTVDHFHIHLIPRYEGGPVIVANWNPGFVSDEEKSALADAFAKELCESES